MTSTQLSILSTLALYAAEGCSALTPEEIYFYLHKSETNQPKPTEKELLNCLRELNKNKLIFNEGDYYSMENRAGFAEENIKKTRQSSEKIKKNKWPLMFLEVVPFARAVAVTGSVAMRNARKKSDLDLLIIAQEGRIWTARIFALLIIEIFGRRRENAKKTEKICLNFFIAENALSPIQNIASANMLRRAIPLSGRKKYHEFLDQNWWTENFIYSPAKTASEPERASPIARLFEYLLGGKTGDWLEQFFKDWQYRRLTGKITTPQNLEHFILTDKVLMLHYPNPKNTLIMEKYDQTMSELS